MKQNIRNALVKASIELEASRAEIYSAESALQALAANRAQAIMAWIKINPPPTQDQVHRQMMAKEQAEKLARVKAGLTPEPVKPAPVYRWPLEEALAAGKVNKRPNYGPARR
jgi:hypothetical protein